VGIATGSASGLLVLEIDARNGGDASYDQLRKKDPAAFTELLEVRTGSGDTHLYFECRTPTPSHANILPGIHVKANADYVVAPPSLDVGGSHQFASSSDLVLPPLPAALSDLIFQASSQTHKGQGTNSSQQSQRQQSQNADQSSQTQSQHAQGTQSQQARNQQGQSQTANQSQQHSQSSQTASQGQQSQKTAGIQPAPLPWPHPVDGAVLFDGLTAALGRHLALPEGAPEAVALWILLTHVFDVVDVSPRLALLSPLPECGKTTAFAILSRLVLRGSKVCSIHEGKVCEVLGGHLLRAGHHLEGINLDRCGLGNTGLASGNRRPSCDGSHDETGSADCEECLTHLKSLPARFLISAGEIAHTAALAL
jgi:hypothetical protein